MKAWTGKTWPVVVLLAAGRGRRLGGGKLLRPVAGRPLLSHLLERLAGTPYVPGVLVHRPEDGGVRALAEAAGMRPVAFSSPGRGASLAAGIRACPDAPAWLVLLGDQPLVQREQWDALTQAWRGGARAVFADGGAGPQPPAVFDASLRTALLSLKGEKGGRSLVGEVGAEILAFPSGPWMEDVDTEGDLRRLENWFRSPGRRGGPTEPP